MVEIADALELDTLCSNWTAPTIPPPSVDTAGGLTNGVFVDPYIGSDDQSMGSIDAPFASISRALAATRGHGRGGGGADAAAKKTIVLREGTHYLLVGYNKSKPGTMRLTAADSGLTVCAFPGEEVWISGGLALHDLTWRKAFETDTGGTVLSSTLPPSAGVDDVPGLFAQTMAADADGGDFRRLTRARFPDGDVEVDQWGYNTPTNLEHSIDAASVSEWWKPEAETLPKQIAINLTTLAGNPTGVVKNDSAMDEYNWFGSGIGGACDLWDDDGGFGSYWCADVAAGGWAFVDNIMATTGLRQLPIGMTYNTSEPRLARFSKWKNATGAVVHAWHGQSWFVDMWNISDHDPVAGNLTFDSGGWQGGRVWCTCDQCGYAGPWCRGDNDTRLISGTWYVENVLEELDQPTEYFFNKTSRTLFLLPNATWTEDAAAAAEVMNGGGDGDGDGDDDEPSLNVELVVPVLQTLVSIEGTREAPVRNVTFSGIRFRDAAATFMERWGVPSGGDWAFYRGAAFHAEGSEGLVVRDCLFKRLDGNAFLLSGYNREATIERSEFVWIAGNALGAWGRTDGWDGTGGDQPRGTTVRDSLVHELGFFEKQSSAWFQAKTAETTLENNIFFNLPRAAVNFNDGFGGANAVKRNLVFNTCRESGDHGDINSWDRMPFLTDVAYGADRPSFDAAPTEIADNFIMANYGASQGVDNDDGSSWYDIHDNVFYSADGFKMDYGGHDSTFHDNYVITLPYDNQNCLNIGGFVEGHGDAFFNNTCVVMGGSDEVASSAQCGGDIVHIHDNHYFTLHGNASITCAGETLLVVDAPAEKGVEMGSTAAGIPGDEQLIAWAKEMLGRF